MSNDSLVPKIPDTAFDRTKSITDVVSGDKPINQESKAALASVLHDYQDHFQSTLVAVTRQRVRRLLPLLNLIEAIEESISERINTRTATTDELIRFYRLASDNLREIVDLLERVKNEGKTGPIGNSLTFNFGDTVLGDKYEERVKDKNSREKIRNLLTSILSKIQTQGAVDGSPAVESSPTTIDGRTGTVK